MGYACPVCETPQADAEHLANHLAFVAMLHDDGHAAWLEDHVPDWADRSPEDLAPVVADHAEPAEYDAVFEDTTGAHGHGGGDAPPSFEEAIARQGRRGRTDLGADAERILAEARELTDRMRGADDADGDEGATDPT